MVHYTVEDLSGNFWLEKDRLIDRTLQADGVSYQAYYSEVGKAHHTGKDLTEVRSLQRKLVPDKVGLGKYEQTSLRAIAMKARACAKHRFQNLYRLLNAQFLMSCWKDLNKNAASGVDKVTAEAYAENLEANIEALEKRLKQKRYRAKLVRRCYIPKENGKERPLGIPTVASYCTSYLYSFGMPRSFVDFGGIFDQIRQLFFLSEIESEPVGG